MGRHAAAGSPLVARVILPRHRSLLTSCSSFSRACAPSATATPPIGTLEKTCWGLTEGAPHVLRNPSHARSSDAHSIACFLPPARSTSLRTSPDLGPGAPSHEAGSFGDGGTKIWRGTRMAPRPQLVPCNTPRWRAIWQTCEARHTLGRCKCQCPGACHHAAFATSSAIATRACARSSLYPLSLSSVTADYETRESPPSPSVP
ncbi:hypothetical protein EDB84DRAFT_1584568, partial [Lactarius hengduanensis]